MDTVIVGVLLPDEGGRRRNLTEKVTNVAYPHLDLQVKKGAVAVGASDSSVGVEGQELAEGADTYPTPDWIGEVPGDEAAGDRAQDLVNVDGAISGDLKEAASQRMVTEERTDNVGVVVALGFRAIIIAVQCQDYFSQGLEGGRP